MAVTALLNIGGIDFNGLTPLGLKPIMKSLIFENIMAFSDFVE